MRILTVALLNSRYIVNHSQSELLGTIKNKTLPLSIELTQLNTQLSFGQKYYQ